MNNSATYHDSTTCYEYPSTLEKIKRVFDFNQDKKLSIVDLGCGDGRIMKELADLNHSVTGIDSSREGIKQVKKNGLTAIEADLERTLPIEDNSFDVALLLDTLEHLYDQSTILSEANRILKHDGKLIISFPNHFDIRNRFATLFGKGIIHWAHKKYENAIPWSYGHVRFLLFKQLNQLLELHGFYPEKAQFNFMAGGIVPTRFTPAFFRKALLKSWPQLFTGKYVVCYQKQKTKLNYIYLPKTPHGM